MATPINAPLAGEIWHLSIEDLFQPVEEAPRLGGQGPFVINLSVSTAPICVPTKSLTSRADAHVYQIQVTEDGRTRFRLRLGPFATEDEADAVLAEVRDTYPGALTATAGGSDIRVIESMQAKAQQRQSGQKAADKVVIAKAVSQQIAAEKVVPQKTAPQPSVAQKAEQALPEKKPLEQKVEVSKLLDAEISIDIAWPTPELAIPPAPLRAAPIVPAPVMKATPPPVVKAAPSPVPARAPLIRAAPPVIAQEAVPPAAASTLTWALPELDIPLQTVQKRPTASVVPAQVVVPTKAEAPPPTPFVLAIAPPFELAGVAPTLTEVVVRSKTPKSAAQKPAVNSAPVLTEAVVLKAKVVKPVPAATLVAAPVAAAPTVITPVVVLPPVVAAPKPLATAATVHPAATPTAVTLPAATARASVAPKTAAPPIVAPAPAAPPATVTAIAPTPTATPVAAKTPPKPTAPAAVAPAPPKRVAPPTPPKPAPVLPQSMVTPRKTAPKFRMAPAKSMPNRLTSLQHVVVATAAAPAPREVKKLDEPLPDLESTQTIRALTPKELEDNEASRWFVIQLALADHAFDPDAVPNLDIFGEYRLYSVAGLDQGRVVHALRLGFFREEIGAVAVASYLAAYWDKPTIKRVSVAERERFADQRVEARKDVGATGKHSVIEITDELVARRRRSAKASTSNKTANYPFEH